MNRTHRSRAAMLAAAILLAGSLFAQATPAGSTPPPAAPPDDKPSVKVGVQMFGDYTYQESPTATDSEGNSIHNSTFEITRAYINITGQLNHDVSFRITPDISRETGAGSSLSGSETYRLKYAYGQFNLDDWSTKGSWVKFGVQQTPFTAYEEEIYRYRFEGQVFVDAEGEFPSSDAGLSGHYNFPGNYGDVQMGYFNGEGYQHVEVNNEKAFQARGTVRPLPLGGIWKGLRITGFYDDDHYVEHAIRRRVVGQVTFESKWGNAGFDYLKAKDQTIDTKPEVDSKGYSVWATPKLGNGWELLLRRDQLTPNELDPQKHTRSIAGIAYWLPDLDHVSTAIMLDYSSLRQVNPTTAVPDNTAYGLKFLINY